MKFLILGDLTLQAGDLFAGEVGIDILFLGGRLLLAPGPGGHSRLRDVDFKAARGKRILVRGQFFRLGSNHGAQALDIFLGLAHAEIHNDLLPGRVVLPHLLKNGDGGCIRIHGIPQTPVALEFFSRLIILISLQEKIRGVACKRDQA